MVKGFDQTSKLCVRRVIQHVVLVLVMRPGRVQNANIDAVYDRGLILGARIAKVLSKLEETDRRRLRRDGAGCAVRGADLWRGEANGRRFEGAGDE